MTIGSAKEYEGIYYFEEAKVSELKVLFVVLTLSLKIVT